MYYFNPRSHPYFFFFTYTMADSQNDSKRRNIHGCRNWRSSVDVLANKNQSSATNPIRIPVVTPASLVMPSSGELLSQSFSERQRLSSISNSRYFTMIVPITFSNEEIQLLRESFSPFVKNSSEIGFAVIKR